MVKSNWKTLRILLRGGWAVLGAYFKWMIRYSRHPERYSLEERYNAVRKLVFRLVGPLGIQWDGENEKIVSTTEPCLFVSNHTSALDPLFLIIASPKPVKFVAKIEAAKMPFIGRVLKILDCALLDRKNPRQALQIFAKVQKEISSGLCSYCIYPEGTRNKAPQTTPPGEFHGGSFKIAFRAQCPVCLYTSFGGHCIFHLNENNKSELLCFRVHEPMKYESFAEGNTQILAAKLQEECAKDMEEFQQKEKAYFESGKSKKKPTAWWKDPSLPFPVEMKK